MLRQLTIQNRSPVELRQLAAERRQLASTKVGRVRELLLNEARLLDYQAELRAWTQHPDRLAGDSHPARTPNYYAPPLPSYSLPMALPTVEREALLSAASALKFAEKDTLLTQQDAAVLDLHILCSGMAKAALPKPCRSCQCAHGCRSIMGISAPTLSAGTAWL